MLSSLSQKATKKDDELEFKKRKMFKKKFTNQQITEVKHIKGPKLIEIYTLSRWPPISCKTPRMCFNMDPSYSCRKATEVVESAWQHCNVKEPHINGSQCLWRRFEKDAYRHDSIQQIGPRQFILCFYSEIEKLEYLHRLVVSGKEGKWTDNLVL